ncbi:ABC transporter substrate-binding protein [Rhodococcus wratislaviensis]|uniref:Putative ABC transporter substrate-binding protein n=1 Tax=Rhodococcus wratislaviensis NBRC 100605 TaxID=1219028 RepID=X0QET4_RHOWR|nr:ABC transporter substrate-binding protein [Rhodococcus wratislaviensis]GAF50072.1 putative ABC transporter substrate-binding protein [Rhodococcus wratislaviensis NBRC 100605]
MSFDAVSRRKFLALGGVGAVALALASCGRTTVPGAQMVGPPSGIPGAPPGPGDVVHGRSGGSVVTAWTAEGNSYDAQLGYDLHSWEAVTSLLYLPLFRFEGQAGGPAPAAAAALPEISEDGTRYVIRLRPDVKFHNGRPVVADDYVYAWRRLLDPATESWASGYFGSIVGSEDYLAGISTALPGVYAQDDLTLIVELSAPDVTFTSLMAQPYAAALPREEVERLGEEFGRMPVGNGPFMITSYDTKNRRSVFVRSPYYPWPGLPFLDEVVYRWGIDPSMQFLQLQNGDVDILGEGLTPTIAERVQGNPELRETYTKFIPVLGASWAALNVATDKLADPRVRQALNWATDKDQLAKYSRGLQKSWGAIIPEEEPDYQRIVPPYSYDLTRAKALMKDAGVDSLELEFFCNDDDYWKSASLVLQQQWAEINVDLNITTLSNAAFWTALDNGEADVFGRLFYQVQPTGLDILASNFVTGASSNFQGYSNPRVDDLAGRSLASLTREESNAHLARAEAIVAEDAPGVFIGSLQFYAMRSPRVQNYQMRAETGTYYDRIWV